MVQVDEISRIEDLHRLHLVWKSLWQQTTETSFLRSLDWLRLFWQHHRRHQQLRVLVVSCGSETVGILPLTVAKRASRVGEIRSLTYARCDDHACTGPVGPNPTATLTAALRHVAATPRDWDILELSCGEHDRSRTELTMQRAGVLDAVTSSQSVGIDITSGWREFLATRPRSLLREVHQTERAARRCGKVEFERHRPAGAMNGDDNPRWDLIDECDQIATQSATSGLGHSVTHDEPDFFRETHSAAVAAGAVDVSLLRIDGQPVACAYAYHNGGRLDNLRLTFDERWGELMPVKLLLARLISDSCRRGDRHIEMGPLIRNLDPRWATHSEPRARFTGYARTLRGRLLRRGLRVYGLGSRVQGLQRWHGVLGRPDT